jgi:hypothetical protein
MNWGDESHYMIHKIYNASISTCVEDILDIWLVENMSKNIKANIQINSLFQNICKLFNCRDHVECQWKYNGKGF